MADDFNQDHKEHRPRLSGTKAAKKKRKRAGPIENFENDGEGFEVKKKKARLTPSAQRNPKAFTFHSAVKAAKALHR